MKQYFLGFFLCALCATISATGQVPSTPQTRPVIILGGTVHTGTGRVIENGYVSFENGKIAAVGDAATIRPDNTRADVIDATGKHVYPGLIATNTSLGLSEIGAVRATNDYAEVGFITPHVRSIVAYNTDSQILPTIRSNGILLAQVAPEGGLLSGSSAVVQMDGWNWEDATYKADDGIHLNWPSMLSATGEQEEKSRKRIEKELAALEQLFAEAKAYSATTSDRSNLKLEAMRGLFNGTKKLYIHTDQAKGIIASVYFAQRYGLTPVVVGGTESWLVVDVLKQFNIPVVLSHTHRLPGLTDEDVDLPYKLPTLLKKAGVRFCISGSGNWDQRNLPFEAGTAVAYGLAKEEALAAITSDAAAILGIDSTAGSIEPGKDATLFISTGDVLDMRTSNVETAFIQGRNIDLNNKQKELYHKYQKKYGQKQ